VGTEASQSCSLELEKIAAAGEGEAKKAAAAGTVGSHQSSAATRRDPTASRRSGGGWAAASTQGGRRRIVRELHKPHDKDPTVVNRRLRGGEKSGA
jgi:hypothetical protein